MLPAGLISTPIAQLVGGTGRAFHQMEDQVISNSVGEDDHRLTAAAMGR